MPWTAAQFKQRHNHKLKGAAAKNAAAQATAILRSGASERIAIATANKTGDRMMRGAKAPTRAASKRRRRA